jgi:hypothetical protein
LFITETKCSLRYEESGKKSALDPNLLELATSTDRIRVTEDQGFGDVRKYPPSRYQGIVVVKVKSPASRIALHHHLEAFLRSVGRDEIRGCRDRR